MKAIALISGGLDSTLATRLVKDQGIEIIGLNFKTTFCLCDRKTSGGCLNYAKLISQNLGLEFKMLSISEDFLKIVKNPKHGYGSGMNPCIDCRILKFSKAKEMMQEIGASFIITGEVLGQRPMSQHRRALKIIDKESGLEGLVLRPLSAKLLPQTIPEKEGWVSRDKLLNFNGRSRKPQIELAKRFDIKDYSCPAGGCLLTDPEFSKKIKDLLKYGELNLNSAELLKIGRHFRISKDTRLVVGRNERENIHLKNLAQEKDYLFMPEDIAGPISLGRGIFNKELISLSCSITSRYCDLDGKLSVNIVYKRFPEQEEKILEVSPIKALELLSFKI